MFFSLRDRALGEDWGLGAGDLTSGLRMGCLLGGPDRGHAWLFSSLCLMGFLT